LIEKKGKIEVRVRVTFLNISISYIIFEFFIYILYIILFDRKKGENKG